MDYEVMHQHASYYLMVLSGLHMSNFEDSDMR